MDNTKVVMETIPFCDFCMFGIRGTGVLAKYDGRTKSGSWAWMCEEHFKEHGVGLGEGNGQELVDGLIERA